MPKMLLTTEMAPHITALEKGSDTSRSLQEGMQLLAWLCTDCRSCAGLVRSNLQRHRFRPFPKAQPHLHGVGYGG